VLIVRERTSKAGEPPRPTLEKLKEISFFKDIPEQDLREIAGIMVEKSYPATAVIIEELTEAERFFIIHTGKVQITKRFEADADLVLNLLSVGDFFGEMALLDERPRSATARAVEPTDVLEVSREDFDTLLYKAPTLAFRIMKELSSRLRETGALLVSHLHQRNRQLSRARLDTFAMIADASALRDTRTGGRIGRRIRIAKSIGRRMGLQDEEMLNIELGLLLHDLGAILTPDPPVSQTARIIVVTEAFDDMMTGGEGREPMDIGIAMREILRGAGVRFDSTVVSALHAAWETGGLES
jgi:CRP-like cAMP-binding protein